MTLTQSNIRRTLKWIYTVQSMYNNMVFKESKETVKAQVNDAFTYLDTQTDKLLNECKHEWKF